MYNIRLYAAPAHAVSVTTPVALTICDDSGKIRKSLGMYWKIMMNRRKFLVFVIVEPLRLGITIQISTWKVDEK